MNLSEADANAFSKKLHGKRRGKPRSFWDYDATDLDRFHQYVVKHSGKYGALARLFRPNTVGRLAPNTVLMRPPSAADHARIIEHNVKQAIRATTTGEYATRRISATAQPGLLPFFERVGIYEPSGARQSTVVRGLTEQLIFFGMLAVDDDGNATSLAQPRTIDLDWDDAEKKVRVAVTPQVGVGRRARAGESFSFTVDYNPGSGTFTTPDRIATKPPTVRKPKHAQPKLTNAQIIAARFPRLRPAKGLAARIDREVYGNEHLSAMFEAQVEQYLGSQNTPSVSLSPIVLSGFEGTGKSELVDLAGEHSNLPVVRVDMSTFTENTAVNEFIRDLSIKIENARNATPSGKYMLVFDELDKLFERHPQTREVLPVSERPAVMSIFKKLVSEGVYSKNTKQESGYSKSCTIDVRDALPVVTMNFSADRFHFEADPRVTDFEDVERAYELLNKSKAERKQLLTELFMPNTVSRLLDQMYVMRPPTISAYRKIIARSLRRVVADRLHDDRNRNVYQLDLKLSPAYRRYLEQETVVPSEMGRNTAQASRRLIATHLERALPALPRKRGYKSKPLTLTLHFHPRTSSLVVRVARQDAPAGERPITILTEEVDQEFPNPRMPGRVPPERVESAVHEFGHAWARARLGARSTLLSAISTRNRTRAYVKVPPGDGSIDALIADIYGYLGSRAMERIFFSQRSTQPESVLDVTCGSSRDIEMATVALYRLIYQFAGDPDGPTSSRVGKGADRFPNQSTTGEFSGAENTRLGMILSQMVTYLVEDFLGSYPREWYVERIETFAREGILKEQAFYKLIGFDYPGDNEIQFGDANRLRDFARIVQPEPTSVRKARRFRQGARRSGRYRRSTAMENLAQAKERLRDLMRHVLHNPDDPVLTTQPMPAGVTK